MKHQANDISIKSNTVEPLMDELCARTEVALCARMFSLVKERASLAMSASNIALLEFSMPIIWAAVSFAI